jgi:hypothetical protein
MKEPKSNNSDDHNWVREYYKCKLQEKFFERWKSNCGNLNPGPLKNGIGVFSAFKWISVTLGNEDINKLTTYQFPYHAATETDGTSSKYFLSRLRQYVIPYLEIPENKIPLFVHTIALLDAFQLMKTFSIWKEQHLLFRKAKRMISLFLMRKFFRFWLMKFIFLQQTKRKFFTVRSNAQYWKLKNYFRSWKSSHRLHDYFLKARKPFLLSAHLKQWHSFSHFRQFNKILVQSSEKHYLRQQIALSFAKWYSKLISLHQPFLLLNSAPFEQILQYYLPLKKYGSSNNSLYIYGNQLSTRSSYFRNHSLLQKYCQKQFGSLSNEEQKILKESAIIKLRQVLQTVKKNLSSSQSQIFLINLGEKFFRQKQKIRVLRQWIFRVPQLALDSAHYITSVPFIMKKTVSAFQHWKRHSCRWGFLRRASFLLRKRIATKLLTQNFGVWLILAAKLKLFSRISNKIISKRILKEMYFSFFAWRNQYERSVLLRTNKKTLVILRDQELQEFARLMKQKILFQSKYQIMRSWALFVRDRTKGKRLFSTWFKYSGKYSVYIFFMKWKFFYQYFFEKTVKIQRRWRGYYCRQLLYPKRVNYLIFFRRNVRKIVSFVDLQLKRKCFRLGFLQNLLMAKRRELLERRSVYLKRFFQFLLHRWKTRAQVKFRLSQFAHMRNRKSKMKTLLHLIKHEKRKKLLVQYQVLIRSQFQRRSLLFWKSSFVKYRRLSRQMDRVYYPSRVRFLYWLKWKTFRIEQKKSVLQKKFGKLIFTQKLFLKWKNFNYEQQIIHNFRKKQILSQRAIFFFHWQQLTASSQFFHRLVEYHRKKSLKRRYLHRFRQRTKVLVQWKSYRKHFLLAKYEKHFSANKKSHMNTHQKQLVNFLNRKYKFGNIILLFSLKKLYNFAVEHRKLRKLEHEKLLLHTKRSISKSFRRLYSPIKRKFTAKTTLSKNQARKEEIKHYYQRNSEQYYALLSVNDQRNHQLQKMRAQKAVKTRLYLLSSSQELLLSYYYFQRFLLSVQQSHRIKKRNYSFDQKLMRKHFSRFFDNLKRKWKSHRKHKKLLKNHFIDQRNHFYSVFFGRVRILIRRRRRIRHLFKLYNNGVEALKCNLFLQKWKKWYYLKKKKIFAVQITAPTLPTTAVSRRASFILSNDEKHPDAVEEEEQDNYKDLLDNRSYLYPEHNFGVLNNYKVCETLDLLLPQAPLINTNNTNVNLNNNEPLDNNSTAVGENIIPSRRSSLSALTGRRASLDPAKVSLVYFQQEQKLKSQFRFIAKLLKKARFALFLFSKNALKRKEFKKYKLQPLKERKRYYLLVQFRKLRSNLRRKHVAKQILVIVWRKFSKAKKFSSFKYWYQYCLLRNKFFLIRKRIFLFPIFQKWLVTTIKLLKDRRSLTYFTKKQNLQRKTRIFHAWKDVVTQLKRFSFVQSAVSHNHNLITKKNMFFAWIIAIDQKRMTENYHLIQKKKRKFQLQHFFHLWHKIWYAAEIFTWKNSRVGFMNWKYIILQSQRRQKQAMLKSSHFSYFRKTRQFFTLLYGSVQSKKHVENQLSRTKRKFSRKKLLNSFRVWKNKMYWMTRNVLKLRHHHKYQGFFFPPRHRRQHLSNLPKSTEALSHFRTNQSLLLFHLYSSFHRWFR